MWITKDAYEELFHENILVSQEKIFHKYFYDDLVTILKTAGWRAYNDVIRSDVYRDTFNSRNDL